MSRVVQSNRRWQEKDGIIYFSVASGGTTGPQWIDHLEQKQITE